MRFLACTRKDMRCKKKHSYRTARAGSAFTEEHAELARQASLERVDLAWVHCRDYYRSKAAKRYDWSLTFCNWLRHERKFKKIPERSTDEQLIAMAEQRLKEQAVRDANERKRDYYG